MSKTPIVATSIRAVFTVLWLALAGLFAVPSGLAQLPTASPPERMSYQGFLADGNGVALATNAPKNYDVIFRIYNDPSASAGANLFWAEQQSVTVDKGYYSLVLGEGTQVGTELHNDLSTIFTNATASDRYMEMTVKGIGAAGGDVKILPRLRLLSSPYAFLAQRAVSAAKLVNSSGGDLITSSGNSVTIAGAVSATTVTGNGSGLTGLNAGQIPNLDAAKITSGILADGRLSGNVAKLNTANSFSAAFNSFSSSGARFDIPFYSGGLGLMLTSAGTDAPQFRFTRGSDFRFYDIGQNTSGGFTIEDTDAPRFTIATNGNVGIGTTTPQAALHVAGINGIALGVNWATGGYTALQMSLSSVLDGYAKIQAIKRSGLELGNLILNPEGGNVGIGTTTPTQAKLVVSGTGTDSITPFHVSYTATGASSITFGAFSLSDVSIKASGAIHALYFRAVSDARIKIIKGRSDGPADLAMLTGIEITDYTHKDVIGTGGRLQKKVIGQQIEQVFPQAVSRSTDVVPDIYKKATQKDGWVELATDLKKGERVRLIGEKTEGIHEVLEVTKDKFRTNFKPEGAQVFVYGREVKDFRTVDYEAIAMLNVSATQELARRLEKVEARESHVAELERKAGRVETLEQEVADLKKMVAQLAADSKSAKLAAQATKQTHAAANATAEKAFTTASLVR